MVTRLRKRYKLRRSAGRRSVLNSPYDLITPNFTNLNAVTSIMLLWFTVCLLISFQIRCVGSSSLCCYELGHSGRLVKCVTNRNRANWADTTKSSIVFATFVSERIHSYAGHNILFNENYFETSGFDFHVLTSETGDDHYPPDRRWNKIKAVAKGLVTWAKDSSFLVFMDADLVLLDPHFDILSVIAKYPTANLILAADEIDMGNTGFMIVRNVPWSIDFFNRWWAARDTKDTFCDQHVLNGLLLTSAADRGLVAITPAKEINSKWPAIENFAPSDPILHLMGETHETRNAVAKYLAEEYCALTASGDHAPGKPVVVPLTQAKLMEIKQQTITDVWEASKIRCAALSAKEKDYDELHENIGHRCDPSKRLAGDSHVFSGCEKMLREAMAIHLAHLQSLTDDRLSAQTVLSRTEKHILHLNHLSMLEYDLLELMIAQSQSLQGSGAEPSSVVFTAAQQVLSGLEHLEDALDMQLPSNYAYIHHKRGMVFIQLCGYHQAASRWDAAVESARVSLTELHEALQVTSQKEPQFPAFVKSYIHAAARLAQAYHELQRLDEAEEWANIALTNANLVYASTSNEERLRRAELTDLHMLCRSIYSSLQNTQKVDLHSREIDLLQKG